MSLIGLYPCSSVSAPTALSITSATVGSILSFTAFTGNLLVLLAVIIDPDRNLRSRFNFLVANLAAADLMVGCFLPMSVEYHIRESMDHPVTTDDARRIAYFLSCTASLLSLAALAIDRFIAIKDPMKYRVKMTTKQAFYISLALWVISAGPPFLYFQVGDLNYRFFFGNTAVLATFAVLCLTYAKVFKNFKRQVDNWDTLHDGHDRENRIKMRAVQWQKKVTKTFLILLAVFVCCFIPALIFIYVIGFCANCHCTFIHWARDMNYILIMANSSLNPFVFTWRLKRYRRAFAKILTCGRIARKFRMPSFSFQRTFL